MARITVVIFMLSSVLNIGLGRHHEGQVHNVTRSEKRSQMKEEKVDPNLEKIKKVEKNVDKYNCEKASYREVPLIDFVYLHGCFPAGWEEFLDLKEVQEEIQWISLQLNKALKKKTYVIVPPMHNMFKAFTIPRDKVKVVILGQDPTPQPNQATGMAFSLKPKVDPRTVPSVLNMLVELKWEGVNVGLTNGDLTPWRNQGVLLLNTALTVRQGQANSHRILWKQFTISLIKYLSEKGPPSAWILWGKEAQAFEKFIDPKKHYIKSGYHPSRQSATGFFGGNYFSCANEFLIKLNRSKVNWQLEPSFARPMEQC